MGKISENQKTIFTIRGLYHKMKYIDGSHFNWPDHSKKVNRDLLVTKPGDKMCNIRFIIKSTKTINLCDTPY